MSARRGGARTAVRPDTLPPSVLPALAAAERAAGEPLAVREPWGATPSALHVHGARSVAYLADGEAGRERVRREAERLALLAGAGVPVPAVRAVAPDGTWLVVERVPADPPLGAGYVEAALAAAAAVARLPLAAVPPTPSAAGRRAAPGQRAVMVLRLLGSRLPVRAFLRLRAAAARLPDAVVVHGDLHPGNVLHDRGAGRVHLVDLELLGRGPVGLDLAQLWCGLAEQDDRDRVRAALVRLPGARPDVLLPWTALRTLADETVALPRAEREGDGVRAATARWREAAALLRSGQLSAAGGAA